MNILSEIMKPGDRADIYAPIPHGKRVTGVFMDPPTAAAFTIEGEPVQITAGEMLAYSGIHQPAIRVAVVHRGAEPARFRAAIDLAPELDAMQRSVELAVEDAWRRGGDPIPICTQPILEGVACGIIASFTFTWPGRAPQNVCTAHAGKARELAKAAGFPLAIEPVTPWRPNEPPS